VRRARGVGDANHRRPLPCGGCGEIPMPGTSALATMTVDRDYSF
jgi:hypothetical protein